MSAIEPYRRAVAAQEAQLRLVMARGKASAFEIALDRVAWQGMLEELTVSPKALLIWDKMGPDQWGLTGPDRWARAWRRAASEQVRPQFGTPEQELRKYEEYLDYSLKMLKLGQVRQDLIVDKENGRQYLILGAHPLVGEIMFLLSRELMRWVEEQPNTRRLIDRPAWMGFATMLTERPDLSTLLRIAEHLPLDVEVSQVPVDRPAMVEAVELAIGLIPLIGNVVAAYESWRGVDLFGYRLSDLERGILGASVLLPAAGRLVKGGRAIYTEARLVALYGHDAASWSKAIRATGHGPAEHAALATIAKAERALRVERSVTGALAREAADAVPRLAKGGHGAAVTVDLAITDLLRELHAAHPQLQSLDSLALERVLAKGPNVDHLKGQLLEELLESRLVPWLRTRDTGFALGIAVPEGKKLEFIPGHLIRDMAGRQISDGMLVIREGEELTVAAVFEAKAGKNAARELSLASGSLSSLTKAERAELRANAKDVWLEQRQTATAAGKPYTKTIEEVEMEYSQTELGGQVRRDVERLAAGTGGPARIRVGGEEVAVRLSPTKTKFFGVLPSDVRRTTIEAQLKESGFAYEILGIDVKADALKKIANALQPLAGTMAGAAP